MSLALLCLMLHAVPADADVVVREEPGLHFVAQLELSDGARSGTAAPFFVGGNVLLGLRFDPVRFGVTAGLASAAAFLDFGGFFSVDLVRLKLDSKRSVALFTTALVNARYGPSRPFPFTLALLGEFGVRIVGISLGVVGGAEVPTGVGGGEVRLGVDFVELLSLF